MRELNPSRLSQEFLDDYFSEADEHLLNVRRLLADLNGAEGKEIDRKVVDQLFHHFHSFKGISAIVGLEPAEALAHAAEDLLRLMRDRNVRPGPKALQVLDAATHKMEQIVSAFRLHQPLPPVAALLAEVKREFATSLPPDPRAEPAAAEVPGAPDGGEGSQPELNVWKFTFSPTQELTAQKITITTIREQLAQAGEILKSTPVVKGKSITFEFLIARAAAPTDAGEWAARGVTIEPVSEATAAGAAGAAASSGATESTHSPFLAPSHVVRVDLKRLDGLLRMVGEMVIHRSRLDMQLARLSPHGGGDTDLRDAHEVNRMLGRSLRQMREEIMRIRLVPIAEIFARLPFVVNDLARQTAKKVSLKLAGQDTAIDKYLVEKLKDPLLHMVRNAFSHGIETAAERHGLGKPEGATIELSASIAGDVVIIKVRDDGKGMTPGAIFARAKKMGLAIPQTPDNEALLQILCSPGFSTRDAADRTSGRGVGMDVVYSTIKELGGKLTLETEAGKGTQFTIRLPLTVVIADTLLVSAAGQTCAVPQSSVREIFHAAERELKSVDGIEAVAYRGGVLPITRLAGLFHSISEGDGVKCVLVIASERGSIGLLVDEVVGQREVVVRAFRDPLLQVHGISGATELGDGKPVLILDGAALTAGNVRPVDGLDGCTAEPIPPAP